MNPTRGDCTKISKKPAAESNLGGEGLLDQTAQDLTDALMPFSREIDQGFDPARGKKQAEFDDVVSNVFSERDRFAAWFLREADHIHRLHPFQVSLRPERTDSNVCNSRAKLVFQHIRLENDSLPRRVGELRGSRVLSR